VQDGLEERLVGLSTAEQLGVGDQLLNLVALQGVLLDALDGTTRKERVDLVDPLGHGQGGVVEGSAAAATGVAAGAILTPVEKIEGTVAAGLLAVETTTQPLLGIGAEHQPPTHQALTRFH